MAAMQTQTLSDIRGILDARGVHPKHRFGQNFLHDPNKLRDILDRYAAMPQIARFSAGLAWRDMSEAQQDRFTDAFGHYLSTVYARRFQDYSGVTVSVGEVRDGGRRGLVVETTVPQPKGQPIIVEWLVSDRPGRTVIGGCG